ncbi:Cysteinyl-tRNA synthetase [Rubellimicrobium mesophilum DSM 19309]|uniref:Cysteine--tRNA ligase n=1 Tax=Rubellimicrobium mesophilum DSM 19309 TaxID=442562 RepID=A0A017HQT4_9RHOB|nr:cysteine--tRNA ligase [Rubellimicrobium mesophilum]EYD76746.1 Cysteinyl-tRNA synthetase [Rubellimicrobium mesophilum DSM 19309]
MTTIRLTNTKTRRKEVFEPLDPQNVRMYVCGPTVYDRAHLGNARPVVVFDTLFRLLRHVYGADHVTYVRNFTDVDDKINDAALARKNAGDPRSLEELIHERTEETIRWYHEDMKALGALPPNREPRATQWIGPMIAMIQDLIEGDHAYEREGHVLFRVRSYSGYGALSGRSVDDMIAGARVEIAPYKEDPLDFVLWKPSDESLPGWSSPWGRGRPGWHIECSAMAKGLLGPAFDIHGGGIDLQFPHHENEIAQSCCANPEAGFAKVWMHNEMLQVEGKKMSKSLGNFFTVRDLLKQQVPGEVIRLVLLGTHYSKPMDWTEVKWKEADAILLRWEEVVRDVVPTREPDEAVVTALADDLDTSRAITELHRLYSEGNHAGLAASLDFLGIEIRLKTPQDIVSAKDQLLASVFEMYLDAKASKDFSRIDHIKSRLKDDGIQVGFYKDAARLDAVDLEQARMDIFHWLPSWKARKQFFREAVRQSGENEFSLSRRALTYQYFIRRVQPLIQNAE